MGKVITLTWQMRLRHILSKVSRRRRKMGRMKELSIVADNEQGYCVGCEFIAQFSPHDGGYCKVHGDIKPAHSPTAAPYDWCCPECQELDCECDPPRPKSKDHPQHKEAP